MLHAVIANRFNRLSDWYHVPRDRSRSHVSERIVLLMRGHCRNPRAWTLQRGRRGMPSEAISLAGPHFMCFKNDLVVAPIPDRTRNKTSSLTIVGIVGCNTSNKMHSSQLRIHYIQQYKGPTRRGRPASQSVNRARQRKGSKIPVD